MTTSTAVRGELSALAFELLQSERFSACNASRASARVSEPLLPVMLAALWLVRSGGVSGLADQGAGDAGLVVVVPDDGDARDIADAVSSYIGGQHVGVLTSRGVRHESGLEPPVHLVGERARALHVAEQGGFVCASALGFAEGAPPPAGSHQWGGGGGGGARAYYLSLAPAPAPGPQPDEHVSGVTCNPYQGASTRA